MDKILIIVPAYNEQDVIEQTVLSLKQFTTDNNQFEYLVIDDGSKDETRSILSDIKANYLSHPVNLGIGEPFKTGIKYGLENGFTRFINFDADGQHRLDNLHLLTEVEEYDYVIGSRFVSERKPRSMRMLGSSILSTVIKLKTGKYIADPTSGLLLINNKSFAKFYINQASNKPEPSLYPKIVNKFKVVEVQVQMEDRSGGDSYFNLYSSIHFMLEQVFMILLKG